jgi:uncharacterized protein YegP (UPF0339 family)
MPAQFEVRDSKDGQYYAVFRAANGEIVWWTERYRQKQNAVNASYLMKERHPARR